MENMLDLNLETLEPIEVPLSDAFWTGFGLGAGTVLAAAGVVAGIAALT